MRHSSAKRAVHNLLVMIGSMLVFCGDEGMPVWSIANCNG